MPRGRKKGTPKTGGRKAGTPNKSTGEIKSTAQAFGQEAFETVIDIMRSKDAPLQVKLAAAREALDRAYGKAPQAIGGADDMPPLKAVIQVLTGVPRDAPED